MEIFRFGVAGVLSAIVDMGIFAFLCKGMGVHYLIATNISFLFALSANYALSVMWVFKRRKMSNKAAQEMIVFSALSTFGILINMFFMWFFTGKLKFDPIYSKLIAIGLGSLYGYLSKKVLLFR